MDFATQPIHWYGNGYTLSLFNAMEHGPCPELLAGPVSEDHVVSVRKKRFMTWGHSTKRLLGIGPKIMWKNASSKIHIIGSHL